jgi:hypothetical protein
VWHITGAYSASGGAEWPSTRSTPTQAIETGSFKSFNKNVNWDTLEPNEAGILPSSSNCPPATDSFFVKNERFYAQCFQPEGKLIDKFMVQGSQQHKDVWQAYVKLILKWLEVVMREWAASDKRNDKDDVEDIVQDMVTHTVCMPLC